MADNAAKPSAGSCGLLQMCAEKLNNVLVAICGDYQKPKKADEKEGKIRQWARVLLVALVAAMFAVLLFYVFFQTDMLYYTKRVYSPSFKSYKRPFFDFSADGERIVGFKLSKSGIKVLCPCSKDVVSWPNFTRFFTYAPTQLNVPGARTQRSDGSQFCEDVVNKYKAATSYTPTLPESPAPNPYQMDYNLKSLTSDSSSGLQSPDAFQLTCDSVLSYILNKPSARIDGPTLECSFRFGVTSDACFSAYQQVPTSWLLESKVLNVTVANQILGVYERRILLASPTSVFDHQSDNTLNAAYVDVLDAFYGVLVQHIVSGGADVLENDCTQLNATFFGQVIAVGMEISWQEYFLQCNPAYCDVLELKSTRRRIYDALVTVGALFSLAGFLLQQLAWPLVILLLKLLTIRFLPNLELLTIRFPPNLARVTDLKELEDAPST